MSIRATRCLEEEISRGSGKEGEKKMIHPWFDPNTQAWIPGVVLGCISIVLAGLVVWLVPRGRAKSFIVGSWSTLWALAILLLAAGLVALFNRQPWAVWYGLMLPGVIGMFVLGGNLLIILKKYRDVAQHRH
jgi:cytochrome bd-type quinol oxidase subunit 1